VEEERNEKKLAATWAAVAMAGRRGMFLGVFWVG